MLPSVTNSALGGGVQLAAFVQDRQQQQSFSGLLQHRSSWVGPLFTRAAAGAALRPSAAAACGLLVVASACCPPRPRSGRLQACASRSKTRRRRGGSGGSGADDGDFGADWPFDSWSSLHFGGGSNDGGGGSGGWNHNWGSAGGDAFHHAVFHCMWLWQLLCAASLLRSLYFLLFADSVAQVNAVTAGPAHLEHVAMAC